MPASSPWSGSTASMLEHLIAWLLDRFRDLGYPGIVVLMAVESSILPLPSELGMPPAGYLAAKGAMNFVVAVDCGVPRGIPAALGHHGPAAWLRRAPFLRLGHYELIHERQRDQEEREFGGEC